jgi:hypothetical protein
MTGAELFFVILAAPVLAVCLPELLFDLLVNDQAPPAWTVVGLVLLLAFWIVFGIGLAPAVLALFFAMVVFVVLVGTALFVRFLRRLFGGEAPQPSSGPTFNEVIAALESDLAAIRRDNGRLAAELRRRQKELTK